MKQGIFPFLLIAGAWWIVASSHACAQAVRVAVAGDASLANLVDVATAELSKQPELSVLDRADLDKLGQEQELQAVLDSKDFSPVRLLPADGLVLLRAVAKDGKSGVFARLVAVQPGVVLREFPLPEGADPLTQVQALAKEFAPSWSKLAAIQKGKITALSLLGLRFEVDAPETREMERSINMLLASRLSAEPDTLVLERWRLNDALFEKTLGTQPPSAFWTGSGLIDGRLRWDKDKSSIAVNLRLRPPHGNEVDITDADTADHLTELVGRLAEKIHHQPSAENAWKSADEADHFAKLGKWCLDNRLFAEGTEAIESAIALGDKSPATRVLLVKAYAMAAFPDSRESIQAGTFNYRASRLPVASLPERVFAATRAAILVRGYLKDNSGPSAQATTPPMQDPIDLSLGVLHSCLRILWAAYDNGLQATHPDDFNALRHEARDLTAELGEKLLPQPPSRERGALLSYRAYHAGLLSDKPEETIAFYREALKSGSVDGSWIRRELFQSPSMRQPFLDSDAPPNESVLMEVGPPWIAAWDGRSPADLKVLWQKFLAELAASSDPVLQGDSLKLELLSNQTRETRSVVVARYLAFLQQHSSSLSGPHSDEFIAGIDTVLWEADQPPNAANWDGLTAAYVTFFKQHLPLAPAWIEDRWKLRYGRPDSTVPADLLAALNDYDAWYQSQQDRDSDLVNALAKLRKDIYQARPELNPVKETPSVSDFLPVNRFLNLKQANVPMDPYTLMTDGNQVWFLSQFRPHKVVCIDPEELKIVSTYPIPVELDPAKSATRERHCYLEVSPDWLIAGISGEVFLGSRASNLWRALDVPVSSYKPRWVNQQLYLLYNAEAGDRLNPFLATDGAATGSGLIRVSLPDGKCDNLVSSRRTPPANTLDGQLLGKPLDLWLNADSLNIAFADLPVYALAPGKNDWSPATNFPARQRLRPAPGGALIEDGFTAVVFGQLLWMKDGRSQVLLSDRDNPQATGANKPLWNFPREIDSHHYPQDFAVGSPVLRGDDLCLYFRYKKGRSDGKDDALYYFTKGHANGLKIPLAFDIDLIFSRKTNGISEGILQFDSVQGTSHGLVLAELGLGLWVIPWSDIDAYRAKYGSQAAAATSSATTQ